MTLAHGAGDYHALDGAVHGKRSNNQTSTNQIGCATRTDALRLEFQSADHADEALLAPSFAMTRNESYARNFPRAVGCASQCAQSLREFNSSYCDRLAHTLLLACPRQILKNRAVRSLIAMTAVDQVGQSLLHRLHGFDAFREFVGVRLRDAFDAGAGATAV